MEIKTGGGCLSIFGLPFLLAGIFIFFIGLRIIPVQNASEMNTGAWIVVFLMSIAFTAVGSALVFGRKWISLDRNRRHIWFAWGLLRPMKGTLYRLDDYHVVQVSHKPGDSDSSESFPLQLRSKTNHSVLNLCNYLNYSDALDEAVKLASFFGMKAEDISSGITKPIVKGNKPLDARALPPIPVAPYDLRSKQESTEKGLLISLPGHRFSPFYLMELVFPLILIYFTGSRVRDFFMCSRTPLPVQYAIIGFFVLFFFIIPGIGIFRRYRLSLGYGSTLLVNPAGIELNLKTKESKKWISLPKDRIIDIEFREPLNMHLSSGKGDVPPQVINPKWQERLSKWQIKRASANICIRSRDGIYSFGEGLSSDELSYLYSLILHSIRGAL